MPTSRDFANFFIPRSIAVVGASDNPNKVGGILTRHLKTFKGEVFYVNLSHEMLLGKECYKKLSSLGRGVDLALVCVPAEHVLSILEDGVSGGCSNYVIYSSGFGESGDQGVALEKQLKQLIKKHDINVLGPNCFGFLNQDIALNVTFGTAPSLPGKYKLLSQSGALTSALFDFALSLGTGFSEVITLGNKVNITENDIMTQWLDVEGYTIGMYLESITGGRDFFENLRKLTKKNSVVILKPGKTTAAQKTMRSHTGALAGEDRLIDAAIHQAGALRCESLEEFFNIYQSSVFLPKPLGNRVGVVTNAGGPAVLLADDFENMGLSLATFSSETIEKLRANLPSGCSISNPVDVLGDALAERYNLVLNILSGEDSCDSYLVLLTPQAATELEKTAEMVAAFGRSVQKPVICAFIGGNSLENAQKILLNNNIPVFNYPNEAIGALATYTKLTQNLLRLTTSTSDNNLAVTTDTGIHPQKAPTKKFSLHSPILSPTEIGNLFDKYQIPQLPLTPVLESHIDIQYPVVLKLISPDLLHKSDKDAVVTNIFTIDAFNTAHIKLSQLAQSLNITNFKICMQKQVSGIEIIVGVKNDPEYGPILLLGAGGVLAELMSDVQIRLLPITAGEVTQMLSSLKIAKMFRGYRQFKPIDLDKLSATIMRFCDLAHSLDSVSEIEINPLILNGNDIWAVDVRIL